MYTLFIMNGEIKQLNNLNKKYARQLAIQALYQNKTVQVLTPNKKYITLTLKDILEKEIKD